MRWMCQMIIFIHRDLHCRMSSMWSIMSMNLYSIIYQSANIIFPFRSRICMLNEGSLHSLSIFHLESPVNHCIHFHSFSHKHDNHMNWCLLNVVIIWLQCHAISRPSLNLPHRTILLFWTSSQRALSDTASLYSLYLIRPRRPQLRLLPSRRTVSTMAPE